MAENSSLGKKVSLDLARELLIAISESLPENIISSETGEEHTNGHHSASVTSADKIDKLRSELISISYVPPDKIALPANGHP
ncbi:hypothetical protein BVRB_5g106290 [Beta vulgaris subsp. vulgaris]|nr:hypothetical protein BVRB_5g106290 [Beta vulgaris subsp. vulgaris]